MNLRPALCLLALSALPLSCQGIDLTERYPTTLTEGDASPNRARPWEFAEKDIFHLSGFQLQVAELMVKIGPADLGLGHSVDGAVWAIVLPREGGKLTSPASTQDETIAHVWLRFHPKQLARLFPSDTVVGEGAINSLAQMRVIAHSKFTSSWHAGWNAMIPDQTDLTVDIDTKGGPRRFFVVNTGIPLVEYVPAFEERGVRPPAAFTQALAEEAFDQLWGAFDRDYAMFALRPEIDWGKLREQYRPKALAAGSVYEFSGICAEMLKRLRDLHIWLKVAGAEVPVFHRPRSANANPSANQAILGKVNDNGSGVQWAVTTNRLGYLAIYGWSDPEVASLCDQALEQLRDTRGLILDVRLNGGGSEDLAQEVAGRFLPREFIYAYSQFRNGPGHTNLTEKFPRGTGSHGPWRYDRPVILLIGQKCMSSNESFVAMMSGDPEVTIMGDHTCGSSGNPKIVQLPMDMTVSVPRWIDYLPDGSPIDERGFQPQVLFKPGPGAFDGEHDDLLVAALERLGRSAVSR
jgi:hypothetical protein